MSPEELELLTKKGEALPSETAAPDPAPVQAVMLLELKSLHRQLSAIQFGCRLVCLLSSGLLAASPFYTAFMPWGVIWMVSMLLPMWVMELRRIHAKIDALEKAIGEATGGKWEDALIKSKNVERRSSDLGFEQFFWAGMLMSVVVLRLTLTKGPIP